MWHKTFGSARHADYKQVEGLARTYSHTIILLVFILLLLQYVGGRTCSYDFPHYIYSCDGHMRLITYELLPGEDSQNASHHHAVVRGTE